MARSHEYIKLKESEEKSIRELLKKGEHSSRKIRRSRILLLNHEQHKATEIIGLVGCSRGTVYQVLSRYKSQGLEYAIQEKARSGRPALYVGLDRAKITALACSDAPKGHQKWTLRLLSEKAVELKCVNTESICYTTIRRILKKTT